MAYIEIRKSSWGRRSAELDHAGFAGVMKISNWSGGIPRNFETFVVDNFEEKDMQLRLSDNQALKLYLDDVSRVYNLPCSGKKIDIQSCPQAKMDKHKN